MENIHGNFEKLNELTSLEKRSIVEVEKIEGLEWIYNNLLIYC